MRPASLPQSTPAASLTSNAASSCSIKDKSLGRSIGQLKVKDSMFDETLGGSFVSAVIANHIIKTSKVDISGNKKALGKVMSQSEKVKFILSANKDSPISIEGLDGDYDYSGCAAAAASTPAPLTSQRLTRPALCMRNSL